MNEDQTYLNQDRGGEFGIRTMVAVILVALGIAVAFWVLSIVYATINNEEPPAIIEQIRPENPITVTTPAGEFTLPDQTLTIAAYGLLFFYIAIAGGIAKALLSGGTHLLRPSLERTFKNILNQYRQGEKKT